MKRAVVIGASSGMGRELAKIFSAAGYEVGISARRLEMLEELQRELPGRSCAKRMDVAEAEASVAALGELIAELGGMDVIVISSALDYFNPDLKWGEVKESILVNVMGFAALANAAYNYFDKQGGGHIVGISSLAALRGSSSHPTYSASKAFVSNYMEGLRIKAVKSKRKIHITDIRPGFVDTPMTKGQPGMFWVATAEKAARQIFSAIQRKKQIAYITRRWGIVARFMRNAPARVYEMVS